MRVRSPRLRPLLGVAVLALAGCAAGSAPAVGAQEVVLTLEVAPERVPCRGEMEMLCLQVRAPGEDAWRRFYDPIEGFDWEEGVRYTLEVARRDVPDPPADASSYAWRLLRIVDEARGGG